MPKTSSGASVPAWHHQHQYQRKEAGEHEQEAGKLEPVAQKQKAGGTERVAQGEETVMAAERKAARIE